jgi:hypothetical protein
VYALVQPKPGEEREEKERTMHKRDKYADNQQTVLNLLFLTKKNVTNHSKSCVRLRLQV